MVAPLDQSVPTQIAQAAPHPPSDAAEPTRTAQLPADCERASIDVAVDVPVRYHLPQIPDLAAFRKQTSGESIIVSSAGHGQLVMDHFVTAARSSNPPVVVLGDGTVLTAAEVLARPEQVIAPDLCMPQQLAQADGETDAAAISTPPVPPTEVAPAAGAQASDQAAQQLANIAPAAAPAGGAEGGPSSGGRFNSTFAPSTFDGLNYGAVDPLAFGRASAVLQPTSSNAEDSPAEEPPPPEPEAPLVNDASLRLGDVAGKEDLGSAGDQIAPVPGPQGGPVALTISITTADAAESVTGITISGVPAGVTFNHGQAGPNGTWLLSPSDLPGLALIGVPADGDQDFVLTVEVAMTQNGQALPPLTGTIAVTIDAVADIPTLTLTGTAAGSEDTAIALPDIAAALQDADGSETLTLTISGVPAGATLSAGTDLGNGTWSLTGLTQAQLDALTITPPADFSGTFDLTVTATSTEGATVAGGGELQDADNTASTSQSFTVTVDPARDSTLSVADTAVKEDLGQAADQTAAVPLPGTGAQPLTITLSLGAGETVTAITISGVPAGVTLNHGTGNGDGTWSLTQADLGGLAISGAPTDSDAEFDLGVTIGLSQNGAALPNLTGSIHVVVDAVADLPTLELSGSAAGTEDTPIALPDIAAALQDVDGSETLTLTISGVPAGATLSAGTDQGGGVWNLSDLTQAELNALTITPPADFSGTFDLTVTATATEGATEAGGGELQDADNTASTSQSFTVSVSPARDSTLSLSDTAVKEDLGQAADQTAAVPLPGTGPQPLTITLALGAGETVTSITISGVPAGVTLNHGTDNGDGTWSLAQADLGGLAISGAPTDSDAEFDLDVTVGLSQNGAALPDLTGSIHVTVDAAADLPTLTLNGAATGTEDTAIALPDIAAALQDADGSETLTLTISGVPAGATLSAGTDQGGGVWSLTGLTQAELNALSITPPANFSGTFDLTVTATATEGATVAGGGELQDADNTASTSQSFTVTVDPGRDSTLTVADTAVKEDLGQAVDQTAAVPQPGTGAQPLTITLALGAGETVTSITISGVPAGVTFNHGTDNGDGTWSLSQADLAGLAISGAPADSDAEFDLGVTVGLSQNGTALPDLTGSIHVVVDAVADLPTLNLSGTAAGTEGTAIALPDITAALQDSDGSETLTLTISGVPEGATLSAGIDQGNGVWTLTGLTQAELNALTITPPADFSGTFDLTVTATSTEGATAAGGGELQDADNTASTSQSFTVTVDPTRDSTLSLSDAAVKEDLGQAADQTAAVPQPGAGAQPLTINLTLAANEVATSVTLTGVPDGVTFNQGVAGPGNTWVLTPAELAGLQITGAPSDGDSDFTLGVVVGLTQGGQALPNLTGSIAVTVDAVADLPTLTLNGAASGTEDTAIALPDIAAALQDSDGSETLTLTISGVPAGATLSAGTDLGNGTWNLTGLSQAELDALTIAPPADFSGTFDLTVTATATESATVAGGGELQDADNTASTSRSFTVTVGPQGDSTLSVAGAAVKEDLGQAADQTAAVPQPGTGPQPLTISLTLGAGETVTTITLSNVPAGVTFNHGTDNGDGTWTLGADDLVGLTISGVTADSDADFDLGVTVGLSQGGMALADLAGTIHVTVDAVADLPTLSLSGTAAGTEDTAIALPDIAAALQDAGESLTLAISGVPTGASLSAGTDLGNGMWSLTGLTPAELNALTITPPADFSGTFDLTVTATATESATVTAGGELQDADNTASTSQSFTVTVDPARDSTLSVADTALKEDLGQAADQTAAVPQPGTGAQPLTINLTLGANEAVTSITISGVPAGVTLNHGTDNGDGTWSLSQADLAGLTINGTPSDSDAEFDLGVTVGLSQNGTALPDLTGSVHVVVDAVADLPTLNLSGTSAGSEDAAIALPDIAAALQDSDGSETLTLTISGVPAGATLSAGTDLGNGVWSLTGLSQAELNALTITPPADFSGTFDLTVAATSTESATVAGGGELQEADNTASSSQSFTVTVSPMRDSTLSVADTAVKEDLGQAADQTAAVPQPSTGPQPLTISLTLGAGEMVTSITISGVPADVTLNHGTDNGDGTWSLSQADLAGLAISGTPSDSDAEFDLDVTIGLAQNGTALPDLTGSIHVTVDAVADLPTLALNGAASGTEDTAIALPDIAAALQDVDGSETLTLTISGVPAGATLSAGTDLGNGTWSLTGLTQAQLDALSITPPADFSGTFDLTVTATSTEGATVTGGGELQDADNTASTSQSFTVTVSPARDSTLTVADTAVKEDLGQAADQTAAVPLPGTGPQPLTITLALGAGETVTSITISGVPAGVTLNHGTDNGDGTWSLALADLAGLAITGTPSDSDAEFDLGVTVALSQNGTALPDLAGSIHVTVDAVADLPTLELSGSAAGSEDTAIALPDIAAALQDSDGSETLTLTISGVPAGATLSAGTDQGGGVWNLSGLTQAELNALTITPPADFSGTFDLTVTATSTEGATVAGGGELQDADNTASTSQSFTVTVDPARDSTLTVADTAVKEDLGQAADQTAAVPQPGVGPQPLTINLTLAANEVATSVTITDVPDGVTFNQGVAGPGNTWVLTPGELVGLQITGAPSDGDSDFTSGVVVGLAQGGQVLPNLTGSIAVTIDAVADIPTLTLGGTSAGTEDSAIALPDIAAALQDTDGSETLTLTVSGVPAGATLSAGTDQGGGVWTLSGLTQDQLNALTITPPADFSGTFDLTVTATAIESATVAGGGELQDADNTATASQSFTVTVSPARDSTLAVADTAVKEDLGQAADQTTAVPQPSTGAQPLTIALALAAGETVTSITISGVPAGVTLNHGTDNGDGTWSLAQADLAGLAISGMPSDSDAEFDLGVTVGLSQSGTALPDLTGSIHVTVDAVADLPTLELSGSAAGTEDTAIALPDIAAALQDTDGSETLTLTISGVPAGATLSAGTDQGGGVWSLTGLTPAALNALTITPPADFSGTFDLTVTATSTEGATVAGGGELQDADNTASTSQSFTVTVSPARDSTLSVADAAVKEDLGLAADQTAAVPQPGTGAQPLTISLTLGAGETVTTITLSNVPPGVTFSHGIDNGDGTWTLGASDLAGLTISGVTADSDADFDLGVTVGLSQDGMALADLTGTIHVTVDAVADLPTLSLSGTAAGTEDTAIALPDIAAALQDAGESLTLAISGVPEGATLSAGTNQGGGVWSLSGLTQAELNALTITPPADFSGTFDLTVTATSTEGATVDGGGELQDADNTASTSQSLTVTVSPARDSTLSVADAAVKEDLGQAADQTAAVPLPGTGAQPLAITLALGAGETVTSITISGVPAGVTLNHGTDNGDGTWSLAQAELAGLAISGAPTDSDAEFDLGVTVGLSQNGAALPDLTGSIHVTVDAVADLPTLTLTGTAAGAEDTAIALPDIAAALQDTDGSETLTLTISGVPAGATLSAGVDQGGGVWSLSGLTQAELNALTVTPPADFSGTFDLTVIATSTEGATVAGGGELQDADNTASTSQSFTVTVDPARDSTLSVADTAVKEDLGQAADQTAAVPNPGTGAQPLTITLAPGAGETVTSITISGVPAGVTLNHGTDNGDGTWSLALADLAGLAITGTPSDSDAEFDLGVSVGLSQNGAALPNLTGSIHVVVDAVADLPTLTLAGTASGSEDTAIALPDIAAALQDSDGSETLTLTISGVPAGATLSAGTDQGGGVWTLSGLTQAELNALTITPPADFSGTFDLTVTATSTEGATVAGGGELQDADNTATASQSFTVTVSPARDSTLAVADTAVKEDLGQAADQTTAVPQPSTGAQPLTIALALAAGETVTSITISGVPAGVTLNHGTDNGDGTWSLAQADLAGLAISAMPSDSDAEFDLGVTVGLSQNGAALPDLTGSVHVTVDAVADLPTLTLTGTASGNQNTAIALPDIAAALQDADGSETLTLTISGVPAGATLSAGTDLGNGTWSLTGLTQAQLDALTITPPASFSGDFNLTVTATATESATVAGGGELQNADNTASTSHSFQVHVNAVPSGAAASASVSESGIEAVGSFNAGTQAATASETASGTLGYSFGGDGAAASGAFTWSGTVTASDPDGGGSFPGLTSGGQQVVWTVSADGLTLIGKTATSNETVATLTITDPGTGAYTYEQIGPFDHPDAGQNGSQTGSADAINLGFGYTIKDASGDSTTGSLTVGVSDDGPVAGTVNKTATERVGANTNLMIVLDVSGSMDDPSGLTNLTRLDVAKAAIAELIEQYDAIGDVKVNLVTFSSGATEATNAWVTPQQALAILNALSAGGWTNYDAALATAQATFGDSGKIAGAQNVAYFLSDGQPNRPTDSPGINGSEQAAWESFLSTNDIKAYALGMGTGVDSASLQPVAYDGIANAQIAPIVVTDMGQLADTLIDTVPSPQVEGSVLVDSVPISQLGADGGYVKTITIDGTTYTYDPSGAGSIAVSGTNHGAFDTTTNTLTVTTANGATMALDMDSGSYVYTLPSSVSADVTESFNYTLADTDGDTASSTMTFNVTDSDQAPMVRSDIVITSINGSGAAIPIPAWALLANDVDPDGQAIAVTGVSNASEGTVANAGGVVTFTDNDYDGGSFDYTGSANGLSDTGSVIVDRDQRNESTLDGTGLGEILIGRSGNDTINGYEGNDILIGNGGTDNLQGGAGNDILVFQGLSSTYNGNTGFDTLRIGDSLSGTLSFTAASTNDSRIENIDKLAMDGGNAVQVNLDYQGVLDFEATNNTLYVSGSAGDTLKLSEAIGTSGTDKWIKVDSSATADTYTFTPSDAGDPVATLIVQHTVTVQ